MKSKLVTMCLPIAICQIAVLRLPCKAALPPPVKWKSLDFPTRLLFLLQSSESHIFLWPIYIRYHKTRLTYIALLTHAVIGKSNGPIVNIWNCSCQSVKWLLWLKNFFGIFWLQNHAWMLLDWLSQMEVNFLNC